MRKPFPPFPPFRRLAGALAAAALAVAPAAARGDPITTDTYIDSYDATASGLNAKNTDVNYGGSAATKVVSSAGSSDYPLATSAVRTLLTLPASFWSAVGTRQVSSAVVSFRLRNVNNGAAFTRSVAAYPLLHAFAAGAGYQPTVPGGTTPGTMGGTPNTSGGAANGADWLTYDGTSAWAAAGGAYDAAHPAAGTLNVVGSVTTMTWDIAALVNDAATRANVRDNGLMVRIADDTIFPAAAGTQQFLSYYSSEGAALQGNPAAFAPAVTFTVVPEPTAAAALVVGGAGLLARRSRRPKETA